MTASATAIFRSVKRKSLPSAEDQDDIDRFLRQVDRSSPLGAERGRLIFALDATASREHSWRSACRLQSQMFKQASEAGELDIQLLFFRGYDECKASPWVSDADRLHRLMASVRCEAGTTQIERVLQHALRETQKKPVHALVYVGDSLEERVDHLGRLAGELNLLKVPLFVFQEGYEPAASSGFAQLARVGGGVHRRFDASSAAQLGSLLSAAAVYAVGGKHALQQSSLGQDGAVQALLKQLP